MMRIKGRLESWNTDNVLCRIYTGVWGLYKFTLSLKIYLKPLIPDHLLQKGSDEVDKSKWKKIIMVTVLLSEVIFLFIFSFMTVCHAAGLVDDTISEDNLYC